MSDNHDDSIGSQYIADTDQNGNGVPDRQERPMASAPPEYDDLLHRNGLLDQTVHNCSNEISHSVPTPESAPDKDGSVRTANAKAAELQAKTPRTFAADQQGDINRRLAKARAKRVPKSSIAKELSKMPVNKSNAEDGTEVARELFKGFGRGMMSAVQDAEHKRDAKLAQEIEELIAGQKAADELIRREIERKDAGHQVAEVPKAADEGPSGGPGGDGPSGSDPTDPVDQGPAPDGPEPAEPAASPENEQSISDGQAQALSATPETMESNDNGIPDAPTSHSEVASAPVEHQAEASAETQQRQTALSAEPSHSVVTSEAPRPSGPSVDAAPPTPAEPQAVAMSTPGAEQPTTATESKSVDPIKATRDTNLGLIASVANPALGAALTATQTHQAQKEAGRAHGQEQPAASNDTSASVTSNDKTGPEKQSATGRNGRAVLSLAKPAPAPQPGDAAPQRERRPAGSNRQGRLFDQARSYGLPSAPVVSKAPFSAAPRIRTQGLGVQIGAFISAVRAIAPGQQSRQNNDAIAQAWMQKQRDGGGIER